VALTAGSSTGCVAEIARRLGGVEGLPFTPEASSQPFY
jgi:hypothetical protein